MQRTVKGTKFIYPVVTVKEDGTLVPSLESVSVGETNLKKAYKKAVKIVGHDFQIHSTEEFETLYILDDNIFFKYARPVENTTPTKEEG